MLGELPGDDLFFIGIREYYRHHLHSASLTEDFYAVMGDVSVSMTREEWHRAASISATVSNRRGWFRSGT